MALFHRTDTRQNVQGTTDFSQIMTLQIRLTVAQIQSVLKKTD